MDPFIGEIKIVPYNFAPRGWAFCNGQILSIAQNSALFSLLGTTFGGDGMTTFALPNLQSRVAIHAGQGPGLSQYQLGQQGGTETRTLSTQNMPQHNHGLAALSTGGNTAAPTSGALLAASTARDNTFSTSGSVDTILGPASIGFAGNNQPFSITPPYLALNFCIALEGIFPSRN